MSARELVATLAATHGERVFQKIESTPDGLTDFELAEELGIYLSSVNAVRNTLMRNGKVKWSGATRPSGRGGVAKVWVKA